MTSLVGHTITAARYAYASASTGQRVQCLESLKLDSGERVILRVVELKDANGYGVAFDVVNETPPEAP